MSTLIDAASVMVKYFIFNIKIKIVFLIHLLCQKLLKTNNQSINFITFITAILDKIKRGRGTRGAFYIMVL